MPSNAPPPAPPPIASPPPAVSSRPCPSCRKAAVAEFRPFCSRGCRDRDLNRWFDEDYRIPVAPAADEGDDTAPSPTAYDASDAD